ncbi:hypothetical protein A2V56_04205 [Candidatus Woesebacteria bacterium RBG_19FT_COMBO_42_9]|uniref:DUF6922 domain-containing protein n=1 Tax=Candidatus Woesebacteria bacterium RBG_16_42_24 TaxID=1802485 RepID=A0A1F7XLQ6_9BACT|nr:MAG: hypothetical protein A2V97_01160 [Candidatus Woesebacteria bacterium RBG_16_42_24]OGM17822.1 MAG: hypothetical protein A2V56_04205 [Candidatus Woesebacteria bacterium RBG_19FT_COMBO_42_9]OGM68098.1 MAG: hypothetical protein A2985_03445 [Candidatus Woesebacteria bacterium RIFCSPLOWO2_01_FULL_43_11]
MSIVKHLHKYFWDINPRKSRPKTHPKFYITRILELGDAKALTWLKGVFGAKKVAKVGNKAKLSSKSKNFLPYV